MLSKRQLAAVFARLRAKGLLRKGWMRSMSAGVTTAEEASKPLISNKILNSIFSQERSQRLLARLPERHRQSTMMTEIRVWDGEEILGEKRAGAYDMFAGRIHVSRSPLTYNAKLGYSKELPLHRPRGSLLSRARYVRNARLGTAKSFYHEFGHSLWPSLSSGKKRTFPAMGEWDGIVREEAFADAYSFFASTKFSRNQLRKSRPLTYKYMESFFKES